MIAQSESTEMIVPLSNPVLGFEEILASLDSVGVDDGPDGYQRPISNQKIAALMPYDVSFGGTVAVNARPDGMLYCFDGGHRMEAARRTGYTHIPARLYHLSRMQEARYFIELNWATLGVSPGDKFRALAVAEDEDTCAIKATIEAHGFVIDYLNNGGRAADAIAAVDTARALCSEGRGQSFTVAPLAETLDLIMGPWKGQPGNGTTYLLRATAGVGMQAGRIGRSVDPAVFTDRMRVYTPALLTRAGGLLAKTHNVPLWRGMGQKMIDELNARLPAQSKNRVPPLI